MAGEGAVRARVVSSRLRVGAFARPGDAVTLTQCDGTTCGATSLLAARLLLIPVDDGAAGLPLAPSPDDGARAASRQAAAAALPGQALLARLAEAELAAQRAMNRRAGGPLGRLPWTSRLGSTPWAVADRLGEVVAAVPGAAGTAEAAGVAGAARARCAVDWVDDRGPRWSLDVARLRAVLASGLPAILLTGGPLGLPGQAGSAIVRVLRAALERGPAIPRHYVLALPWPVIGAEDPGEGRIHVYDPSSGSVGVLDLLAPRPATGPGPRLLGAWPRVLAVIAPQEDPHD